MRNYLICAVAICLFFGCDDPKCEPITGCDIRKAACQHEALKLAACLRGSPVNSQVSVEVVDYDAFVDERVREAQDREPTADQVDRREGLARFGLSLPLDKTDDVRRHYEWVGAFYDHRDKRVTVLDRGNDIARNRNGWTLLLVHEMTHALQGADGLFDTLYDPLLTYDSALATDGLIEGEATLVMDRAWTESLGFDFGAIPYGRSLAAFRRHANQELVEAEDLFVGVRSVVPYAYGATVMHEAYRMGGAAAVAAELADPIRSTRELAGAGPSSQRVGPAIPTREAATLVGSYHLGAFFFDAFLRRMGGEPPLPLGHVVDDVFSVQRLAEGGLLTAWRVRLQAEGDAADVRRFIEQHATTAYRVGELSPTELWILREPDDATDGELPAFVAAPEVDSGFSASTQGGNTIFCRRR